MRVNFIAAAAAVFLGLGIASGPAAAESFLNDLMPSVFGPRDPRPRPEETLQAPFGGQVPAPQNETQAGLMKMYEAEQASDNVDGMDQPNRSPEQIGAWLTGVVTQAMTIDPNTYDPAKYSGNFAPYGFQEFQTYLASSQSVDTLRSRNLKLTAFAESAPVLIQEGALDGAYKWAFRVPIMLTYYDRVTRTLKGEVKPSSQTQRVIINVQVGRVSPKVSAEGMIIERWSVIQG